MKKIIYLFLIIGMMQSCNNSPCTENTTEANKEVIEWIKTHKHPITCTPHTHTACSTKDYTLIDSSNEIFATPFTDLELPLIIK